jgi:hypothetical protein
MVTARWAVAGAGGGPKNRLAEAEAKKELSDSFAEFHINGSGVQGVVKVRDFDLKVSN